MWYFYSPQAIVFGRDALEHLESLEAGKVLIVTDSNLEKLGMVEIVAKYIEKTGAAIQVYDGVEPEPSIRIAEEGAKMAVEFQPDLIVALGGGSCIDSAKAIWVLYERPDLKLEEVNPFMKLNLRKKAKLVAIPTTSGTGSEVTCAMVITDEKRKVKMEIASREIIPDIAIVDPNLTRTLPPRLTAETAMDSLTHAIEA
ncbi:MAG TPA: iron-containing alcohol dehydrogenase [Candidatus Bathyarchaeota archaeon]|nr:iron-containing alcohol dehydrogenase [Candidatus Bathyarchaeota archaeon]